MKHLAVLFLVLTGSALADDCAPIKDALAKQAVTPAAGKMKTVEWDAHGQCKLTVGLFCNAVGREPFNDAADVKTLSSEASCRLIGEVALKGEVVQHYYASSADSATDHTSSEFWITSSTGLLLKRFQNASGSEITLEYDYSARPSLHSFCGVMIPDPRLHLTGTH